jgi:hypothetical protein
MSEDLVDVRAKVSPECHAVMFAVSQIENVDLAELHRRWLHERAEEEKQKAERIVAVLRKDSKGSSGRVGG